MLLWEARSRWLGFESSRVQSSLAESRQDWSSLEEKDRAAGREEEKEDEEGKEDELMRGGSTAVHQLIPLPSSSSFSSFRPTIRALFSRLDQTGRDSTRLD